jgi:hypothetical protein
VNSKSIASERGLLESRAKQRYFHRFEVPVGDLRRYKPETIFALMDSNSESLMSLASSISRA